MENDSNSQQQDDGRDKGASSLSEFLNEVDRVSARMAISAVAGLALGTSIAVFKGSPIGRTSLSVAGSCALTGTACFGSERIADNAIRLLAENVESTTRTYASHAIGGAIGGGVAGGLFQGRILSGSLLFTPLMLSIAYAELKTEKYRKERLDEILEAVQKS